MTKYALLRIFLKYLMGLIQNGYVLWLTCIYIYSYFTGKI